eukprot:TRINITY_DN23463_c0_g1_i1.p1 TRINITY_DN23463_c0_g1~~TRINITY_DN23463_c0_g1_i1.p1  ORF type:complete len:592 (+),score=91.16 TRINITY_DN23463_c0_g1_i1:142-1917(+)
MAIRRSAEPVTRAVDRRLSSRFASARSPSVLLAPRAFLAALQFPLLLLLLLSNASAALAAEAPEQSTDDTWLVKLHVAREQLTAAFSREQTDISLAAAGLERLREVAVFAQDVKASGYSTVLLDSEGRVTYELTLDDEQAVQEFMNEHVFVIIDIMSLVMMDPGLFPHFLEHDEQRPGLLHRIISELRGPYYEIMTEGQSWTWGVPLFGALALLSRQLRDSLDLQPDSYRDALWFGQEEPSKLAHLRVIGEPLITAEYDRRTAYRKACAHLSIADSRSAIEQAERHVKAFAVSSLRAFLLPAAEWPVFELLRRKAVIAENLLDEPTPWLRAEPPAFHASEEQHTHDAMQAGRQHLAPSIALEMYRMVHVVGGLCDALGVRWWMSHGSLIGALRDRGLSRHADDCEFDILSGANLEVFQGLVMRRALARNGYEMSYDPRGKVFKIWPAGSMQAVADEDQLTDQTWWLPQHRIGTPSLDVYVVDHTANGAGEQAYVSNEDFHCNLKICTQLWFSSELESFRQVQFGSSKVWVPIGASSYLDRVYGTDWNTTVRSHRWASDNQLGHGFEATDVSLLNGRIAEPTGPLIDPVVLN